MNKDGDYDHREDSFSRISKKHIPQFKNLLNNF